MPLKTATPNFLPYPVAGDKPDVPYDIQQLAQATHDRLDVLKKLIDDNNTALTKITKLPVVVASNANVVTAQTGFTLVSASLLQWGQVCTFEMQLTATSDIIAPATGDLAEKKMAVWKTGIVPAGNFVIQSFAAGAMALGYGNGSALYLSSLEATQKWAKNGKMYWGGTFITSVARA